MRERGEFERIRDIVAALPGGEGVVVGPGDDAAVLRTDGARDLVVTTDTFVEGRHFRRDLLGASAIGARLAAANVSDLAAMAARPRWALVSCVAPRAADAAWLHEVELACARSLDAAGAPVVGGNLASGDGPVAFTVTLIGDVARGAHWTRAGARAGDVLALTGFTGHAGAALALALAAQPPSFAAVPAPLAARWVAPPSRVALAAALAATGGVHACLDVSDGLAGDLAHLCESSGVGAVVRDDAFAGDESLAAAARALGSDEASLRYGASDDYELLIAIAPGAWDACARAARDAGGALLAIGTCTPERERLRERVDGSREPMRGAGWNHFA